MSDALDRSCARCRVAREVQTVLIVAVAGQRLGLPLAAVRDVFRPGALTSVPCAAAHVAGVLNLRGRIVTLLDLRARLGMPPQAPKRPMAVSLEWDGDCYGLLVDEVGDVQRLDPDALLPVPPHLDRHWAEVCVGIHSLDDGLLIVVDVDRLLCADHHVASGAAPARPAARQDHHRSLS